MTVSAFLIIVFAVVVMVFVHWRTQKRLEERILARQHALEEADEARQHALFKQHKDLTRRITAAERVVAKMVDETRNSVENARLMNERADTLLKEVRTHGR